MAGPSDHWIIAMNLIELDGEVATCVCQGSKYNTSNRYVVKCPTSTSPRRCPPPPLRVLSAEGSEESCPVCVIAPAS